MKRQLCGALALIAIAPLPVTAQTQGQQDRLNRVGRFLVTAPMCGHLGMKLDPDLAAKAAAALQNEAKAWSVDPAIVDRLGSEAAERQGAILDTDMKAAAEGATSEEKLRGIKQMLLGYGRTCLAAVVDPIYAKLISVPPNYDLDKAATDLSDAMLEGGGLASWQTPSIQARGDLMMLAGTCRSKIGAARSDELVKEFGRSDDAKVRGYYSKSFDEGLADQTIIATTAGCNRAIQRTRSAAHAGNSQSSLKPD